MKTLLLRQLIDVYEIACENDLDPSEIDGKKVAELSSYLDMFEMLLFVRKFSDIVPCVDVDEEEAESFQDNLGEAMLEMLLEYDAKNEDENDE